MAWDYAADLATARELIADTGRLVSLQRLNTALADAADPLAGPAAPPDPVAGIPATFVYPSGLTSLGASTRLAAMFKDCEQIALIAFDGVNDFSDFDKLIDTDESEWKIERVEKLKPGNVILMFYVGITRP